MRREAYPPGLRAHELRRTLELLRAYETPDERLVSVYVPADTPIREAAARLTRLYAAAADLPTTTRAATRDAVGALRDRLRDYGTAPANGLALFAGVVDGDEVFERIESPPEPIGTLRVDRARTFSLAPAADLRPELTGRRDRELLAELFDRTSEETAVVGFKQTRRNLAAGAVERLLVAETFHEDVVSDDCPNGHTTHRLVARDHDAPAGDCPECGATITATAGERTSAAFHLCRLAQRYDTDVAFISTSVERGDRLASNGVGALLRYRTGL